MSLKSKDVLKVNSNSELLSYIINATPDLSGEIDLPVQGESVIPIGKKIMSDKRYKNAFINTCNVIGLTFIDRNAWENPWEWFANKGSVSFGQTVREIVVDIADVSDYNAYVNNATHFLENVVPNIYNYMHELNYQKFYKTTTSDDQIAMAFSYEGGIFDLIEKITASLYEAYKYDKYIVDKYQLQRRIVDGTITPVYIESYDTLTPRERVQKMKGVSNDLTFRSPNYNPAGLRKATSFDNQIMIMDNKFEAEVTTSVIATSFFKDAAEMRTRSALIDGFGIVDEQRLYELLTYTDPKTNEVVYQYTPFTEEELTELAKIPAVIVDYDFFQDRSYLLDNDADVSQTEFYNGETRKRNLWLHTWKFIATSYFKNAVVFVPIKPSVTSVTVAPAESTLSAGLTLQLSATVETQGFANKAVQWSVQSAPGDGDIKTTVDQNGLVTVPSTYTTSAGAITIRATSIYDNTIHGDATITVV